MEVLCVGGRGSLSCVRSQVPSPFPQIPVGRAPGAMPGSPHALHVHTPPLPISGQGARSVQPCLLGWAPHRSHSKSIGRMGFLLRTRGGDVVGQEGECGDEAAGPPRP
jgi:hypothetical protein